jgi:hypothetical protein
LTTITRSQSDTRQMPSSRLYYLPRTTALACLNNRCYRQSSARLGHAVAKASIMRILGVPRLPLQHPIPSAFLARSCPGPADSFSPPVPLTYASSLSPPPITSLPSSSPALSPLCSSALRCSPFFSSLSVIGLRSLFAIMS